MTVTVIGFDPDPVGAARVGGDHFVICNLASATPCGSVVGGPGSPLVVYGDTSQDGIWYSGHPDDVLGYEFGAKPFDPFTHLPDAENEDDEWVFPLADPYDQFGHDIIDARGLFAGIVCDATCSNLPTVGFTAYGGAGDDLIIGSQAGDHLAGGSGNDTIHGGRGPDHVYGDSGVNVNILTRALSIEVTNASPRPTLDPTVGTNGATIAPVPSPVADPLDAGDDFLHGDGLGTVAGAGTADVLFGDHGAVIQAVVDPNLPNAWPQKIQTTGRILRIDSKVLQSGGEDVMFGGAGASLLVGGSGNDMIDGGPGDDLIFGDSVELRMRAVFAPGTLDVISVDVTNPRFQALIGTLLYDTGLGGTTALLVDGVARAYRDPHGIPPWAGLAIENLFHSFAIEAGLSHVGTWGNDYLAGGADDDMVFGQLGDDVIQGDGSIESAVAGTGHAGAAHTAGPGVTVVASFEAASDGDDYVEGGGGCDVIFGNLGQDDLIGGSSSLFSLDVRELRPDIQDHIFGGAGTQLDRNDTDAGVATTDAARHARDADVIVGDNGDIIRIVGTNRVDGMLLDPTKPYLTYGHDTHATPLRLVVRGVRLHDYSPFGDDFYISNNPNSPAFYTAVTNDPRRNTNIGGADRLWGESGDDEIHGETKADTIFGGADDDRLHGESGADWLSGGTGTDGILGDDGLLLASRGGYAEPLHDMVATTQITINPDVTVTADAHITVNLVYAIIYTADLEPFFVGNHDIAYGGLGNDFIHGGAGDDALSGAEALSFYYDDGRHDPLGVLDRLAAHYTPGNVLGYNPATTLFRYYSQTDPWRKLVLRNANGTPLLIDGKMVDFLLNFESQQTFDATTPAPVVDDGRDAIFGDVGNDWMVGGTGQDHVYGGYGDDLLQLDDNLESTKITTSVSYDSLCALTRAFSSRSDKATAACVYLSDARLAESKGDTTAKHGQAARVLRLRAAGGREQRQLHGRRVGDADPTRDRAVAARRAGQQHPGPARHRAHLRGHRLRRRRARRAHPQHDPGPGVRLEERVQHLRHPVGRRQRARPHGRAQPQGRAVPLRPRAQRRRRPDARRRHPPERRALRRARAHARQGRRLADPARPAARPEARAARRVRPLEPSPSRSTRSPPRWCAPTSSGSATPSRSSCCTGSSSAGS